MTYYVEQDEYVVKKGNKQTEELTQRENEEEFDSWYDEVLDNLNETKKQFDHSVELTELLNNVNELDYFRFVNGNGFIPYYLLRRLFY